MDIDHCGDEVLLLVNNHVVSTSSKSYTVLILPDSTLMNVGPAQCCLITVGLELSISEAFNIGFIEYIEPTYSKSYSFLRYFLAMEDM